MRRGDRQASRSGPEEQRNGFQLAIMGMNNENYGQRAPERNRVLFGSLVLGHNHQRDRRGRARRRPCQWRDSVQWPGGNCFQPNKRELVLLRRKNLVHVPDLLDHLQSASRPAVFLGSSFVSQLLSRLHFRAANKRAQDFAMR